MLGPERLQVGALEIATGEECEFAGGVFTYPLERRPRKININLYWDTLKKVTIWQREEARYHQQHQPLGPEHELGMVPADLQKSVAFPEEMEAYLLDKVYRKIISEKERDLLLETKVFGRMSQQEWAKARGVPHATVRSWCHRAEQRIREYEEDARNKRDEHDSAD
jgi:hypothetical protein